ncbi:MAG: beta-galactosidase trimerization domain-containing protein [Candidatus Brocadiia bacterium]|jgi:hypothetical protein|nr:beta-galactosidase trimerization domain-containing protein [Candidatus Brocadiia bacterium]
MDRKRDAAAPEDYTAPSWLRYCRTACFDGYSPPSYARLDCFDAKRLVEAVADLGADTLRFQPVGYWAYYPSRAFRVHPDLGDRDLINEVGEVCRKLGIHHYCYTGYGHAHAEVDWIAESAEFADWVVRDPDGKPCRTWWHYGSRLRQKVCILGDAYRAAMRTIVKELCEHDVDGVYFDAPSCYHELCFCDCCRKRFQEVSGLALDRLDPARHDESEESRIEAQHAWQAWVHQCTREDLLAFREIIHGSGKFMLCHNGATWLPKALRAQYRIPDGFMVEQRLSLSKRIMTGLMGATMARPGRKLAQMYVGSYTVGHPVHDTHFTVHNTNLEDEQEILMEGFSTLACGNSPMYCMANRLYFDIGEGSTEPAREVFGFMRDCEALLKDSLPAPGVTIMASWEALQLWRTDRKTWNWEFSEGMGLAMLDARVNFDVCPTTEMGEERLGNESAIALCGASGMSDDQARLIREWVGQGGAVLATWDSGLYDEAGQLRTDGGALKDVLGVEMLDEPLPSLPECYYRITASHPALGEYGPGAVVQGDGRLVPVKPTGRAEVLAECWDLGNEAVRGPAIVANRFGKGRAIYVAGALEAHYAASRVASIRRLFASITDFLSEQPRPFHISAPRGVYGLLRHSAAGDLLLWLLAPIGSQDAPDLRMRQEYVPVRDVEVRLRLPSGRSVKSVRLVRAKRDVSFRVADGEVIALIPALHIAELVHVALE